MRLESQPAVNAFATVVLQRRLLELQTVDALDRYDVGAVVELFAIRLGGGEIAGEADVDQPVVGHCPILDVDCEPRAGRQLVVCGHVLLRDAVGVGAVRRLGGEVHPAELLERSIKRTELSVTGYLDRGAPRVRESDAVA